MTTTTLPRALLEQALGERNRFKAELAALRAALAQQAEPVEPITRLFGTLPVHDAQQTEPTVPSDCADSHQPAQAEPDAYGYASRLAVAIWEKHYKDTAPHWKPLDDLVGVLTQIDNMTSGLTRLEQQAEPVEPVAWSGYDLDGMVEAFSRVIEAHHSSKHPFHNPIDMDARMALRILRGFIPAMKAYAAPPQQAEPVEPVEPVATHRINSWGFCGVCRHDRIPGEGCARQECPDSPQQAEPVAVEDRLARHGIPMPGDPK